MNENIFFFVWPISSSKLFCQWNNILRLIGRNMAQSDLLGDSQTPEKRNWFCTFIFNAETTLMHPSSEDEYEIGLTENDHAESLDIGE